MLTKNFCEFENAVVKSLKSGGATEAIAAHLADCPDCREARRIVSFFQTNLKRESAPPNLPTAGLVWWKSRLREKQRHAERAGQPIFITQIISAIVFGSAFVWLLNNGWLKFLAIGSLLGSIEKIIVPLFAGTIGFLFVCLILIFTLRRYLLEK